MVKCTIIHSKRLTLKIMQLFALAVSCPAAQAVACEVLGMHEKGQIVLKGEHFDPSGNNPYDGASSLSNIRDTCYGKHAKLSSYVKKKTINIEK
jgi:hypothetical protein